MRALSKSDDEIEHEIVADSAMTSILKIPTAAIDDGISSTSMWRPVGTATASPMHTSISGGYITTTGTTTGTFYVAPKSAPKLVKLPTEMTKRVLVAFLDDEGEPVWAEQLLAIDVNLSYSGDSADSRITLDLSLIDQGWEPKP